MEEVVSLCRTNRLSAAANGVLIGLGIFFLVFFGLSGLIGLVGLAGGIALEFWRRGRVPNIPEEPFIKRERFSALANGVLVGMGIMMVLYGGLIGVVGIVAGVGLEIWAQRRLRSLLPQEPEEWHQEGGEDDWDDSDEGNDWDDGGEGESEGYPPTRD